MTTAISDEARQLAWENILNLKPEARHLDLVIVSSNAYAKVAWQYLVDQGMLTTDEALFIIYCASQDEIKQLAWKEIKDKLHEFDLELFMLILEQKNVLFAEMIMYLFFDKFNKDQIRLAVTLAKKDKRTKHLVSQLSLRLWGEDDLDVDDYAFLFFTFPVLKYQKRALKKLIELDCGRHILCRIIREVPECAEDAAQKLMQEKCKFMELLLLVEINTSFRERATVMLLAYHPCIRSYRHVMKHVPETIESLQPVLNRELEIRALTDHLTD